MMNSARTLLRGSGRRTATKASFGVRTLREEEFMFTRMNDLREAVSSGARHWQLLALPTTFAFAAILLIDGGGAKMAPPTGALIDTSSQITLPMDATTNGIALVYADPGRGASTSLTLTQGATPSVTAAP